MARVLVPLAQGSEELEAVTIIDLLRRAQIEVVVAALDDPFVTCSRGTQIIAEETLDDVLEEEFDMIVLPGGQPGANNLNADERIRKLLKQQAAKEKYTAAICAAPKVLANAGLLSKRNATAFPGTLEALTLPDTQVQKTAVVVDGKVVTSRGPGTAMDFALTLIELLSDRDTRNKVESGLQR